MNEGRRRSDEPVQREMGGAELAGWLLLTVAVALLALWGLWWALGGIWEFIFSDIGGSSGGGGSEQRLSDEECAGLWMDALNDSNDRGDRENSIARHEAGGC